MKINKLLALFGIVAPIVATIPTITSCNKSNISEDAKSAEEYIHDRTFSIAGIDTSNRGCFGTAWILSDATKSNFDDFEYYIATNWHVKYGIEHQLGSDYSYYYGDSSNGFVTNYTKFSSLVWEATQSNFCYVGSDTTQAIDMYVAKVKFGSNMPASMKTKLTKLNNQQKSKGYINKFGKDVTKTDNYKNKPMYIGGYPIKKNTIEGYSSGAWRFQEIPANYCEFSDKGEDPHGIDDSDNPTIIDISPQYWYRDKKITCEWVGGDGWVPIDSQWGLSGGSSGSMVVIKDNTDWIVAGISWGGFIDGDIIYGEDPVYFHPCMSLFKTTYKDFTKPYI